MVFFYYYYSKGVLHYFSLMCVTPTSMSIDHVEQAN